MWIPTPVKTVARHLPAARHLVYARGASFDSSSSSSNARPPARPPAAPKHPGTSKTLVVDTRIRLMGSPGLQQPRSLTYEVETGRDPE